MFICMILAHAKAFVNALLQAFQTLLASSEECRRGQGFSQDPANALDSK
jgi:hypothetical protein